MMCSGGVFRGMLLVWVKSESELDFDEEIYCMKGVILEYRVDFCQSDN